jgi:hypothetical protein
VQGCKLDGVDQSRCCAGVPKEPFVGFGREIRGFVHPAARRKCDEQCGCEPSDWTQKKAVLFHQSL